MSAPQKLKTPIKAPSKPVMALAQKEVKKSAPVNAQPKPPAPAPAAVEPKAPACPLQKAPECPKLTLAELEKKGNSFKL